MKCSDFRRPSNFGKNLSVLSGGLNDGRYRARA
jgi:hypothetical protein